MYVYLCGGSIVLGTGWWGVAPGSGKGGRMGFGGGGRCVGNRGWWVLPQEQAEEGEWDGVLGTCGGLDAGASTSPFRMIVPVPARTIVHILHAGT